jgi:hypothetical protein
MSDADIDQALDACEHPLGASALVAEEEHSGSSGVPISIAPPPPIMDDRLADAACTLRLIARRIEAYRRRDADIYCDAPGWVETTRRPNP